MLVQEVVKSSLDAEIKEKQVLNAILIKIKENISRKKVMVFEISGNITLRYKGRLCVPEVDGLRQMILAKADESRYIVHPNSTKMYHDLKNTYWWNGMKRYVADFVAKCMVCQQVKDENMRP